MSKKDLRKRCEDDALALLFLMAQHHGERISIEYAQDTWEVTLHYYSRTGKGATLIEAVQEVIW